MHARLSIVEVKEEDGIARREDPRWGVRAREHELVEKLALLVVRKVHLQVSADCACGLGGITSGRIHKLKTWYWLRCGG